MIQKFKAEPLLYAVATNDRFINEISVSPDDEKLLLECRKKVRACLRAAFAKTTTLGQAPSSLRSVRSFDEFQWHELKRIAPKFRSQGSFVYRTINEPAQVPPQQLDLDDGVYLPMNFIDAYPIIAKEAFFQIVDDALEELVVDEGWLRFEKKNTCARIVVSQRIHIDVPLYAIPDKRYQALAEQKLRTDEHAETLWLDPSEVYLALREDTQWVVSDPAKIERWFVSAVNHSGERLRRVCRYLKAWRDFKWPEGGPSSITLMVCAWETFRSSNTFTTDCEALLAVAHRLPELLAGKVYNPADPTEEIYPRRVNVAESQQNIEMASELSHALNFAFCRATDASSVVEVLRRELGGRVPNRPELVTLLPIATSVRKQPKKTQRSPQRQVRNMHSG